MLARRCRGRLTGSVMTAAAIAAGVAVAGTGIKTGGVATVMMTGISAVTGVMMVMLMA